MHFLGVQMILGQQFTIFFNVRTILMKDYPPPLLNKLISIHSRMLEQSDSTISQVLF